MTPPSRSDLNCLSPLTGALYPRGFQESAEDADCGKFERLARLILSLIDVLQTIYSRLSSNNPMNKYEYKTVRRLYELLYSESLLIRIE
jgi:hypothetical protein